MVANCTFEHVHLPVRFRAVGEDDVIDGVVIRDNLIQDTDHAAIALAEGGVWGQEDDDRPAAGRQGAPQPGA